MEITIIALVILGLAVILIGGNILIYKWTVNRALKKIIRPYFDDLGYTIKKVEFVGLLKTGDFKREGFELRPFLHSGNPMQTIYIYVYLYKDVNCPVRITAKILNLFLFIRRVEYSSLPKS